MMFQLYEIVAIFLCVIAAAFFTKWGVPAIINIVEVRGKDFSEKLTNKNLTHDNFVAGTVIEEFNTSCVKNEALQNKLLQSLNSHQKYLFKKFWNKKAFITEVGRAIAKDKLFVKDVEFFMKDFEQFLNFLLEDPRLEERINLYCEQNEHAFYPEKILRFMYVGTLKRRDIPLSMRLIKIIACSLPSFFISHKLSEKGIVLTCRTQKAGAMQINSQA